MTVVWSLAGHDPMAAAGIQADLRVASNLGVTLRTIIASFTAQNHTSMRLCEPIPQAWLEAQWRSLAEIEEPRVIKLGLLKNRETLAQIGQLLAEFPGVPVICDPVLASSSGYSLADEEFLQAYRSDIFPHVSLLTPNLPEAEKFLGYALQDQASIVQGARDLRGLGVQAVLIKGGHSDGSDVLDYFDDGERAFWLASPRKTGTFRGTGCSLAAAIACELAGSSSLREAVVRGHAALQAALEEMQGQSKAILKFREQTPALGRLSYQAYFPNQCFPTIEDEGLGFYPVVPDLEWLKRLLPCGIHTIQLRLKDMSRQECARAIAEANALCRRADVRLFVNDHWQLALNEGAYGVHLGQEDLDTMELEDLRRLRQSGLRLGVSTHSYEEAARAMSLRPSYIALGPIFATTCKSMAFGPQGIEKISEWKLLCPDLPVVAIGGLQLAHGLDLLEQGADGIAVVSDVLEHRNPEQRTRDWLRLWTKHRSLHAPKKSTVARASLY